MAISGKKYNDGHTHEAIHTSHVLLDTWNQHVTESACANKFNDVKLACEEAERAMQAVYQLIGTKFEDTTA